MHVKVKAFFHIFKNSLLPHADYYYKLQRTKVSFSLKYFVFLNILLSILFTLSLVIKLNPLTISNVNKNLIASLDKFPNDLIISIKNGQLSTNFNHPYFLWLDYNNSKNLLLVVDESASPEEIKEYKSYLLFTKNSLVINEREKIISRGYLQIKGLNNLVINKTLIKNIQVTIDNITKILILSYPLIALVGIIFLTVSSIVVSFMYLVLITGIIVILENLILRREPPIKFVKTLHIALHAVTLPLVLNYIFGIFNLSLSFLPYVFVILAFVFTLIGVTESYSYKPFYAPVQHLPRRKNRK